MIMLKEYSCHVGILTLAWLNSLYPQQVKWIFSFLNLIFYSIYYLLKFKFTTWYIFNSIYWSLGYNLTFFFKKVKLYIYIYYVKGPKMTLNYLNWYKIILHPSFNLQIPWRQLFYSKIPLTLIFYLKNILISMN